MNGKGLKGTTVYTDNSPEIKPRKKTAMTMSE